MMCQVEEVRIMFSLTNLSSLIFITYPIVISLITCFISCLVALQGFRSTVYSKIVLNCITICVQFGLVMYALQDVTITVM